MRRNLMVLLFMMSILFITAVAAAQTTTADVTIQQPEPIIVTPPAQLIIEDVWETDPPPSPLTTTDYSVVPLEARAIDAAGDACEIAGALTIPSGDSTSVNFMTEDPTDPVLACAWGTPTRPQGYRTVWYEFTPPVNGYVTIDTVGSDYDTILAVYRGECSSLTQIACDDDTQGFSSSVTVAVNKGETYYVEVADWQASVSGPADVNLTIILEPIESAWDTSVTFLNPARSRHATAVVGAGIYVLGGQTILSGIPQISNRLELFDTTTQQWLRLADMPGPGISNAPMVYQEHTETVNGQPILRRRLYVPGGYDGNNTTFSSEHWTYDIDANFWQKMTPPPWPGGVPFAWSQTVASPDPVGFYLVGGLSTQPAFNTAAEVRDEIFFYSVENDAWLARGKMQNPRYAHTAVWVNGRVCVAGGIGEGSVLLIDGECYNPASGTWTTTGNMNFPRYSAGSAVGPDGKWYVFGGMDGSGVPIEVVEVYNPSSNSWSVMGPQYELGSICLETDSTCPPPPRAWPRGEFVGSSLWVFGGHNADNNALPLIEELELPTASYFLPVIFGSGQSLANDNFAQARPMAFHVPYVDNFTSVTDFFNVYYVDVPALQTIRLVVEGIPTSSNYDVAIYDSSKLLWAEGIQPGSLPEDVRVTLGSGRYYIVVERIYPAGPPDPNAYVIYVQG